MTIQALKRAFKVIEQEAATNPAFAARLNAALGIDQPVNRSRGKRQPAALDPLQVFNGSGADALTHALASLSTEQLKDIIAEFGMDTSKLAMKWTSRDRLVAHIVSTTASRAKKGDAFRG